jgi:glycosyltransferase involved in cell wall biosynthesis
MRTGGAFKAFYRMIEKAVSGITDRYVCVSASEFDAASAAGIAPDAKFTVIENGIRMSDAGTPAGRAAACRRLGLDPACRIVGSAGRFAAQKGLIYLVESAPPVLDCFPDSRFVLVGDGEERPRIERRLDELSLRRSFILPGRVEDAASLYQAFDVFVLPSLWESLPYSLIEAMAAGNAVVASNVGGVPEALDDGAGVLVPPADAGALSEAIIRLLGNPASGKALGAAARQRAAARYSLDTMLSRTSSLYVSALAEAGDG